MNYRNTTLPYSHSKSTPSPSRYPTTPVNTTTTALTTPNSRQNHPSKFSSSSPQTRQHTPPPPPSRQSTPAPSTSTASTYVLPLGREEMKARLKINSLLLIAFYAIILSPYYTLLLNDLVNFLPRLARPIHLLQQLTTVVLAYNVIEAIYSLSKKSFIPPSSTPTTTPSTPLAATTSSPSPRRFVSGSTDRPGTNLFTPMMRSSPKTRPSPSHSPSPLSRSQSMALPTLPLSPSTPLAYNVAASPLSQSTNRRRSILNNSTMIGDQTVDNGTSNVMNAFLARHSPVASNLHRSISGRESIDRLLLDL